MKVHTIVIRNKLNGKFLSLTAGYDTSYVREGDFIGMFESLLVANYIRSQMTNKNDYEVYATESGKPIRLTPSNQGAHPFQRRPPQPPSMETLT